MKRGLVFTLMNMYYLVLLLTIYVSAVVAPQMPLTSSYLRARNNAAEYWWLSEFNRSPIADYTPMGGCVLVPQIRLYNEDLPDGTVYDDLNEIADILLVRRCS